MKNHTKSNVDTNQILVNYLDGPKVEIIGSEDKNY